MSVRNHCVCVVLSVSRRFGVWAFNVSYAVWKWWFAHVMESLGRGFCRVSIGCGLWRFELPWNYSWSDKGCKNVVVMRWLSIELIVFPCRENEFVSTDDSLGATAVSASCEFFVAGGPWWACCSLKLLAQFLVFFLERYQPGWSCQ